VRVVGVGEVTYARDELVSRRSGQLRYAVRRAFAWEALRPCVVLEATVGSRAWGLADEGSDLDRRGFFVLPFPWTTTLAEAPGDLVSIDGSATYWEIEKGLRQGIAADPNTLEALFVDDVTALDPMGEWLLEARDAFVSRELYGSFGRYALSQLRRLESRHRLVEHRTLLLEHLAAGGPHSLDETAAWLARTADLDEPADEDRRHKARKYIKQLYRSLFDQGLLERADFPALVELAATRGAELDLPRDVRPKNAYNLVRLVHAAIDWLEDGEVSLRVSGAVRRRLLAIKHGEVALAEILAEAEELTARLDDARRTSPLPELSDLARAEGVLARVREEAARRWLAGDAGPWGADAPEPPEAAWRP
jgi:predicted nucleotidyltransferase